MGGGWALLAKNEKNELTRLVVGKIDGEEDQQSRSIIYGIT
jgi:hypothetical protein